MKLHELKENIKRFKYPRTYHLPFSLGVTDDDKMLKDTKHFENKNIVVTEKLDGENTTLYNDYYHARSIDSKDHPSRHYVKQLHSSVKNDIPDGWRIVGENLFAQHSISYDELPDYFMVFAIFNDNNECLSWSETKEYCGLLGLHTVPELYIGKYDEKVIKNIYTGKSKYGKSGEGFVIRLAGKFRYEDFSKSVAKFVRKNHVQTDEHWMNKEIIKNRIKK